MPLWQPMQSVSVSSLTAKAVITSTEVEGVSCSVRAQIGFPEASVVPIFHNLTSFSTCEGETVTSDSNPRSSIITLYLEFRSSVLRYIFATDLDFSAALGSRISVDEASVSKIFDDLY